MADAYVAPTDGGVSTGQDVNQEDVVRILEEHAGSHGGMIAVLDAIQTRYNYLREKALRIVSKHTSVSLVDVYGIATFYRSFSLKPRGKHLVAACLGTACHVRGARRTVEEIERQLGIKAGETTPDREFTFETVNCLGACALGPVVVVDGRYFSKVRRPMVKQLLDETRKGHDRSETADDPRLFPIEVSCCRCKESLMDDSFLLDGHASIRLVASYDHQDMCVRFSSIYGSGVSWVEREIPRNAVVALTCPHCRAELNGLRECSECGAPIVLMAIQGGGTLQLCSRHGCRSRMLDLA